MDVCCIDRVNERLTDTKPPPPRLIPVYLFHRLEMAGTTCVLRKKPGREGFELEDLFPVSESMLNDSCEHGTIK
ncbi:hypothetical protein BS47DRAFT_54010 [Hydnum rufescens UP504]|uniref:Uncharacterized protein n=1 Tax=Hydnum rufescens UP504 TaxID=1448309 RepID=A0A9P6ARH2_9AGAM|nr:hypothetical protein BS47DRAFT_54010 [Hydnum rufescens UP504]